MSAPRFTAGPWVAAPNRTGSCFIVRSAMQIERSAGHVCEVDMWSHGDISLPDFAQAQANAHLIAAAPEMYEALIQARGALRLDVMREANGDYFGTTQVALDAIDAALAKAARS